MRREVSSGGVVYKKNKNNDVLYLVAQSTASKLFPESYWRLPKGHIDEGETSEEAATREVAEEGGVIAEIIQKVDTIKYMFKLKNEMIFKIVTFYLMTWKKDNPEGFDDETQEVRWLNYKDARKILSHSSEKKVLDKAHKIVSCLV